ncbi:uncharacterized protein N7498_004720 [Penicillium cinerascens]|uniref:FAD dependent oxidoreductase domain-containing protein n=1 Tax=Penicillium cinerascens TaxID=70096 RepID=A0A9W9SZP9_9EURO|nr:uncharacterized protein N7498_004720 [Penicillium cinerascens]KAJ5203841.1 hypothetical protein N7498_004720 [Penicillium cinerascens]
MNIQVSEPAAGFPVENPTESYWQTPPLPISDHRTTPHLPPTAEYCIVGSGITGASIAYKLLNANPSAQILMLEGRTACSGATGRNGGHCRAGRYLSFADNLAKWGAEEAWKLEALERATVRNVVQLARDLDIPCDLVASETADVFMDPVQWEAALANMKAREDALAELTSASMPEESAHDDSIRHEYKIWYAEEAREKLLFPKALGAIAFQSYTLSPYKLVCSLLEHAVQRGMNLQTNTMVTSIDCLPASAPASQRRWTICTARGNIQANNVILATNAYTGALYSPLASFIIPTRGQIAVVRPGSNISGSPVLSRSCGLADVVASPYYHSRAPGLSGEGDIVMGGGRTVAPGREQPVFDDSTIHPLVSKYLTTQLAIYFGADTWGSNPVDPVVQEWTGIMGYTRDTEPIVGQAPRREGLWICAGFHGHGMALAFQCAEATVQMLMGQSDDVEKWLPQSYKLGRVPGTGFE